MDDMDRADAVLAEVRAERERQLALAHGGDTAAFDAGNQENDWVAYVCAYAGRAARKVARNDREGQGFRANMLKVAALAVAAVAAHDATVKGGQSECRIS